jgi:glycosyltransferase involved in cell wall biosynthesis
MQLPFVLGGAELLIKGLAAALNDAGHQAEIVTFPFKSFPPNHLSDLMDFCLSHDFNTFGDYHIDKVIATQFPAYYVRHNNKTVWLIHQHRPLYDLYNFKNSYYKLRRLRRRVHSLDSRELSKAVNMFTISRNVADRLHHYNNVKATPLYHPPPGAENYYCAEPYDYIFMPSRLETLKRQDLLIQAFKYVKTPMKAIISGEGIHYAAYQRMIEQLQLKDKVRLIGFITQEEKITLFARCLAVFFGPFDEDYGYVTLEAMLAAKPVITCTDSGGPLEFVVHEENGFVVDPDPQMIAEKLDWLYHHKPKARAMGEGGRDFYRRADISWEAVLAKLLT